MAEDCWDFGKGTPRRTRAVDLSSGPAVKQLVYGRAWSVVSGRLWVPRNLVSRRVFDGTEKVWQDYFVVPCGSSLLLWCCVR